MRIDLATTGSSLVTTSTGAGMSMATSIWFTARVEGRSRSSPLVTKTEPDSARLDSAMASALRTTLRLTFML